MNDSPIKLNKHIVQAVLITYLIIVIMIFVENIKYFSLSLINTFATPPKAETIKLNTDALRQIVKEINIDENSIALIKK